MPSILEVHSQNPQSRILRKVVSCLHQGGIIIYPTDSSYSIGACLTYKKSINKIRCILNLPKNYYFTLMCQNLSEIATYTNIDTPTYRTVKSHTPGPYAFIFKAHSSLLRQLNQEKSKKIALRISHYPVIQSLLFLLEQPLVSAPLIIDQDVEPITKYGDIKNDILSSVDLILTTEQECGMEKITVIDFFEV